MKFIRVTDGFVAADQITRFEVIRFKDGHWAVRVITSATTRTVDNFDNEEEAWAHLNAVVSYLDSESEVINLLRELKTQGENIMANQAELTAQVNSANAKLTKIGTETGTLLTKIEELKAVIDAGPVTPELQAAVDALSAQAQVVDDLVPDVTP